MTVPERESLVISIEDSVRSIALEGNAELVNCVLAKYGFKSIEQIPDCYLSMICNELHSIEAELSSD